MTQRLYFIVVFSILISSCGMFNDNTQSTTKMVASPFISQLYGSETKTLSLNLSNVDHIAWMSLDQSDDYSYFVVNSYTYGGKVKENTNGTSSEVFKNISLSTSGATTDGTKTLQVTITYSPPVAIESDDKPHEATLLITYDLPNTGTVAVTLDGYTQGIAESKCAGASAANAQAYTFTDNKMDFYLCDENSPLVEPNAPEINDHTNHAEITMDAGAVFTFYQVDDSTLCIMGTNSSGLTPSIPNFDFTSIPSSASSALGGLTSIPISLAENSSAECSLSNGEILCDQNIYLSKLLGATNVSPLTLTNGTTSPVSDDCPDFPEQIGLGSYPTAPLTFFAWGHIIPDDIVDAEAIQGGNALVVVEVNLDAAQ